MTAIANATSEKSLINYWILCVDADSKRKKKR